jgi:6-pyruvoyl-tetrahydropterin synthase
MPPKIQLTTKYIMTAFAAKNTYYTTNMHEPSPLTGMNEILVTEHRHFVADHYHALPGFEEPRHGHNWEVETTIKNDSLFRLASLLDDWVKKIDYSLLNEQIIIADRNPTAEVLAELLFKHLEAAGLCPLIVRIREKSNFWAACVRYFENT